MENLTAITSKTARQSMQTRWYRGIATIVCVGVLLWYGTALRRQLTQPWQLTHSVPGFVPYGCHEDRFSDDATQIAVAFRDQCKVVDLATGKELSRLERYPEPGVCDFSSDGRIVSGFTSDKTGTRQAYLWNASDGRILGRLEAPEQVNIEGCYLFFSPDNKKIIGSCTDGLIIWDSSDLKYLGYVKIAPNKDPWPHIFLAWNPVTHEMTGVDVDGKLLKVDLHQKTAKALLPKQDRAVRIANWSPDGTRLVTIDGEDGAVAVSDAQTGTVVASLPEKEVLYACFSPDGKQIATGKQRLDVVRTERWAPRFWDRCTRIWDAESGKLIRELPTTANVTFSPDWSFWAEAGPEGLRIARFDGSDSCSFPEWFDGHGNTSVFAKDNSYLASVNGSGRVAVWQHRQIRSWTDWLTRYELWMIVLAVTGLGWSVLGFTATTDLASTENPPNIDLPQRPASRDGQALSPLDHPVNPMKIEDWQRVAAQTNQIEWHGDVDDDCSADWAGLLLRAERMDGGEWWWAVMDNRSLDVNAGRLPFHRHHARLGNWNVFSVGHRPDELHLNDYWDLIVRCDYGRQEIDRNEHNEYEDACSHGELLFGTFGTSVSHCSCSATNV